MVCKLCHILCKEYKSYQWILHIDIYIYIYIYLNVYIFVHKINLFNMKILEIGIYMTIALLTIGKKQRKQLNSPSSTANSRELHFPQNGWEQFKACLRK